MTVEHEDQISLAARTSGLTNITNQNNKSVVMEDASGSAVIQHVHQGHVQMNPTQHVQEENSTMSSLHQVIR